MMLPLDNQPPPGVEVAFIGCDDPWGNPSVHDAMTVAQGYDSQFWSCPVPGSIGVACVDGVWHWEIDESEFPQDVAAR